MKLFLTLAAWIVGGIIIAVLLAFVVLIIDIWLHMRKVERKNKREFVKHEKLARMIRNREIGRRVFQEIPINEVIWCPWFSDTHVVGGKHCEECPFYLGRAENNNVLCTNVELDEWQETGKREPSGFGGQFLFIEAWRKYGLDFEKINHELNAHGYFIKKEDFDEFVADCEKQHMNNGNYWVAQTYNPLDIFLWHAI